MIMSDAMRRRMYHGGRPSRLARALNRASALQFGSGFLVPDNWVAMEVTGRRSGRTVICPLVVTRYGNERYLVSMLGEGSEWVQNVRAAGGKASIKRGGSQPVQLTEIPPQERASILKAWAQVATSGRHHLPVSHEAPISAFETIAGDYPVFRIDQDRQLEVRDAA